MTQTFLTVAEPQCSVEEFDGELVAINLDTGIYFSIKESGAAIWNDLAAGHSVESLAALAGDRLDLSADIIAFAQSLQDNGLMRSIETATASAPSTFAAIAATAETPELESFGDMQSLLLLDPVHEVDAEAGWPIEKKD